LYTASVVAEQQHQGSTGVEHRGWVPHHAEIGSRICRYACHGAKCLHVGQQDDGGNDGDQELEQNQ
jgi:hypothetical protein